MKLFKGFTKDMKCRGFQYAEGETYHEDKAELCEAGFHACEDVLDCFGYYSPCESVYHEVELEDVSDERDGDDTKRVGKTIKIGAALDVAGICKAHFEYVNEHCNPIDGRVAGDHESVSVGDKASASAGNYGSASAGNYGSASAGYRGSASAGNYGSASAGNYGSASAGYRGSASAGESGSASAGESGSASAGESGSAVSRGCSSVGKNGVAVARGEKAKARGGMGAVLVVAIESWTNYEVVEWLAGVVDGETLKADTWYTVKDGKFVEVTEE